MVLILPEDPCLERSRAELADPRLERLSLLCKPSCRGEVDASGAVLAFGDFVGVVEALFELVPLVLLILRDLCDALNVLSFR